MSFQPPSPDHPAAVSLTATELDELNNRVLSGDADQSQVGTSGGVARLGTYVLLEHESGDQHVEMHPDEQAARQRYDELLERYVAAPRD